jgi:glycosyltransferase involved in cell wall biosynthesis
MIASGSRTPDDEPSFSSVAPSFVPDSKRPLNICIASPEFIGPANHGNTGIAYTALAQALAATGHQVTCLLLGASDPATAAWQRWVEKYKSDGLALVALPRITASDLVAPSHLIKSYEAYHWLKRNDRFDIIHFPDRQGPGYHTLTAKHHGLAFGHTTICVGLHSMTAWLKAAEPVSDLAEVDTEFMERRAVALADAVVSPSHYLLNWIADGHWEMPGQRYVQQNFLRPSAARPAEPPVVPHLHDIAELVYFGTLEPRKGITLFCDALDSIPSAIAEKIQSVTFLGKETIIDGVPARIYVQRRAQQWPFPFQIIADLDETRMMDYLRQKNRLAVIPSLAENSPYRVLECLEAKIAFIASRIGGVPELIAPSDVSKVCFEPNPGALRLVLCAALAEGFRPARAVLDARANEQVWLPLRENSLERSASPVQPPLHRASVQLAFSLPDLSLEVVRSAMQALSVNPADIVALKTLARIHLNAGLHEAAQEACQLILKRDAQDAEALQMIEEALIQEARLKENLLDASSVSSTPEESYDSELFQTFAAKSTTPFAHS